MIKLKLALRLRTTQIMFTEIWPCNFFALSLIEPFLKTLQKFRIKFDHQSVITQNYCLIKHLNFDKIEIGLTTKNHSDQVYWNWPCNFWFSLSHTDILKTLQKFENMKIKLLFEFKKNVKKRNKLAHIIVTIVLFNLGQYHRKTKQLMEYSF